eukprot:157051_1
MFKKWTKDDGVALKQAKSSVARKILSEISEQYPMLEADFNDIFPKKAALYLGECTVFRMTIDDEGESIKKKEKLTLVMNEQKEPWFVMTRDNGALPAVRTLHKYPNLLPHVQVDKGAIRFVMKGSHIMCPGLTSPGAKMEVDLEANTVCAVMAEGKEHALAVGLTRMSTQEIRSVNRNIGVETLLFLNDGLWSAPCLDE